MTRLLLLIFFISSSILFAGEMPTVYFDFETKRNDILFKFGEPEYRLNGGHLHYEFYSGINTLETVLFMFDEEEKLIGQSIDIGLDYGRAALSMEEFQKRVFKHYKDNFINLLGKPYLSNDIGIIWKFDNAFAVFQPYIKDTFQRYKFFTFPKEFAEDSGYGEIYSN